MDLFILKSNQWNGSRLRTYLENIDILICFLPKKYTEKVDVLEWSLSKKCMKTLTYSVLKIILRQIIRLYSRYFRLRSRNHLKFSANVVLVNFHAI